MSSNVPDEQVVAALVDVLADVPGVSERKMFGCPCFFIDGNMFAGVHRDMLFLKLPNEDRDELLSMFGARVWNTGKGVMRQYACPPPAMLDDPATLREWVVRAREFAGTLPKKSRKGSSTKPERASHMKSAGTGRVKLPAKKTASNSAARRAHR
jgi:TfoX/Sxy family transcriptional regulator of competence genes